MKFITIFIFFILFQNLLFGGSNSSKPDTVYTIEGEAMVGDLLDHNIYRSTIRVDGQVRVVRAREIGRVVKGNGTTLYPIQEGSEIAIDDTTSRISSSSKNEMNFPGGLQFRVNDFLQLSGFSGSTVSLINELKEGFSYRIGISVGAATKTQESEYESVHTSPLNAIVDSTHYNYDLPELNSYSLGGSLELVSYGEIHKGIRGYFSGGAFIAYAESVSDDLDRTNGRLDHQRMTLTSVELGVLGCIGAEWKVHNNLGIHAEYLSKGSFSKGTLTNELNVTYPGTNESVESTDTTDSESFGISSGVLIGLTFYLP